MLKSLFNDFAKELEYLRGTSPETIKLYHKVFKRYENICGNILLTKQLLSQFFIRRREMRYATATCNITIRGFNSFLTWLEENEHTPRLRIKQLKEEKRTPPDIPIESLKKLITYKPKGRAEQRAGALAIVLIDTGCRIKERLTLKRSDGDFDNFIPAIF